MKPVIVFDVQLPHINPLSEEIVGGSLIVSTGPKTETFVTSKKQQAIIGLWGRKDDPVQISFTPVNEEGNQAGHPSIFSATLAEDCTLPHPGALGITIIPYIEDPDDPVVEGDLIE